MQTLSTSPAALAELQPPRGYGVLAWLGLVANVLVLPLGLEVILFTTPLRTANIVVFTSAVLPSVALGVVACIALLKWRLWGQVLAIMALSLDLAIEKGTIERDRLKKRFEDAKSLVEKGFISFDEYEHDRIRLIEAEAGLKEA